MLLPIRKGCSSITVVRRVLKIDIENQAKHGATFVRLRLSFPIKPQYTLCHWAGKTFVYRYTVYLHILAIMVESENGCTMRF